MSDIYAHLPIIVLYINDFNINIDNNKSKNKHTTLFYR